MQFSNFAQPQTKTVGLTRYSDNFDLSARTISNLLLHPAESKNVN